MDTITQYQHIIEQILSAHARIPFADAHIHSKTVFQHEIRCYLLLAMGWQHKKRVHDCCLDFARQPTDTERSRSVQLYL